MPAFKACRLILIAVLAVSASRATAQDALPIFTALEGSVSKIIDGAEKSIVAITRTPLAPRQLDRSQARNPLGVIHGLRQQRPSPARPVFGEFATGIIVAPPDDPTKRFVLTCYHAVEGGQPYRNDGIIRSEARLSIQFSRTDSVPAQIYAADPRSDLAVLAFDPRDAGLSPADLPALPMTAAKQIRKGQFVVSLGNPYAIARDGSPSVSLGMVSNISRFPFPVDYDHPDHDMIHHYGTLLHVDTRLGPGTSGGALLNGDGALIGISTSLAALEGYETAVGYAVPVNTTTRRIIDDLLRGYEVEYGFLGVNPGDRQDSSQYGSVHRRTGVVVLSIMPDSPAARSGLQERDVILAINGREIVEVDDLFREVGLLPPGTTAQVRILRKGIRHLNVSIAKWPVKQPGRIIVSRDRHSMWRGMRVDWPTSRMKHTALQGEPYPRAVVINSVETGSQTQASGLKDGDLITHVNGTAVEDPATFANAVRPLRGDVRLKMYDGKEIVVHP